MQEVSSEQKKGGDSYRHTSDKWRERTPWQGEEQWEWKKVSRRSEKREGGLKKGGKEESIKGESPVGKRSHFRE